MSKASKEKIQQMKEYQDKSREERNNPEPKSYTLAADAFNKYINHK